MILLIDNYDSFVHNLARYFRRLGQKTQIVRNDDVTLDDIAGMSPQAVILSPGPGTPQAAGICIDLVRCFSGKFPVLGICLGHQAIGAAFGATVTRANEPMHGRTSLVTHEGTRLFDRIPSPLTVCRYHSLIVDPSTLPSKLVVTAHSEDGTVMAIEHNQYPLAGIQFHPEATLTQFGFRLLANFLEISDIFLTEEASTFSLDEMAESEFCYKVCEPKSPPAVPVTF